MKIMGKFCFNCGKEVKEEWAVCANCGAKLDRDEDYDIPSPQPAQPQYIPRQQPYQQPYQQPPQYPQYSARTGSGYTYGLSSVISAFVGCCCIFGFPLGLLAVILGAVGMKKDEQQALSLIGIILGVVGILISILLAAVYGALYLFY